MTICEEVIIRYLQPSEVVFRQGEEPLPYIYIVREGAIHLFREENVGQILVERCEVSSDASSYGMDKPFDAVFWTAGSGPAKPVCDQLLGLQQVSESGRLVTDKTLRCVGEAENEGIPPPVWALGDCSEVVDAEGKLD